MFGGPPAAEREASSIAQLESRMSERFSKLEASLAQVLTCVQSLERRTTIGLHGAAPFASPAADAMAHDETELIIRRHADKEGRVRPPQLLEALTELGAFGHGDMHTLHDVDKLMRMKASDKDIDSLGPRLQGDDVLALVREAVDAHIIVLPEGDMHASRAKATEVEDQLATVLRVDPQVRSMMRELRAATRANVSRANASKDRELSRTQAAAKDGDDPQLLGQGTTSPERTRNSGPTSIAKAWWHVPVLHPDGRVRSVWNVLMAVLICWCAVVVPLEIGYDSALRAGMGESFAAWEALNYSIDFIFIADILLNFRTGFVVDGRFVTDGERIARYYIRGPFVLDLLGSFPINLIIDLAMSEEGGADASSRLNRPLRLLRIIKLNRLIRLSKLSKHLKYLEAMVSFNPAFLRVLKLVVLMVCCCHWMGCTWWLVTELELSDSDAPFEPQNSWHPSQALLDSNLGPQFASGFFWGAGVVTAMVPYDIMPATEAEYYVTAACMFIGLMLNAFVIGSMSSAMAALDSKKQMCRGKLETIGLYLMMNNVSADLRGRILEYFEYLYTSSQSMEDMRLLHDLPPSLAARLTINVHKRIVSRTPLFNSISDHALLSVLGRLRPVIYVPGQMIAVEGQLLRAVNFLKKGRVQLVLGVGTDVEREVRVLGPNDSFGLDEKAAGELAVHIDEAHAAREGAVEPGQGRGSMRTSMMLRDDTWYQAFLKSQAVRESARALAYCDVMSLTLEDLAQLLARDFTTRSYERERMNKSNALSKLTGVGRRVNFMNRMNRLKNLASGGEKAAEPSPAEPAAKPLTNGSERVQVQTLHDSSVGDADQDAIAEQSQWKQRASFLYA